MTDVFSHEFPALAQSLAPQYAVERELGRGGMGVVYLARDLMLERPVALKVLPADLARSPETKERFLREARTAARLSHPNIVPVYRAAEVGGAAFFTMAYVEGGSLADRLRDRGVVPAADAVRILREVAWALAYAHARGVVHRDVKPENIFLDRDSGRALVGDFGIARQADGVAAAAERLTQDGLVLGTVHYMSPEQVSGASLDGRSDLYALGVVAFEALSGKLPFEGLPMHAVLVAHVNRPAPPLRELAPSVPGELASVIDRCLAKNPDDRYATGEALADALTAALLDVPATPQTFGAGLPPVVSEEQASAIWRRAAQLQAEALQRLESRRDLLTQTAVSSSDGATTGYKLPDVAAAAEEAGISRQYVALALAELPQGVLAEDAVPQMALSERVATRYLGTDQRSLAVSRIITAPAGRVLRALGVVLQQAPFGLQLRETVGAHPLDGGVIVFNLPQVFTVDGSATLIRGEWISTRHQLEAEQLHVTLRALPGEPQRTEVSMSCDLRRGVSRKVRSSKRIASGLGGLSGVATSAILAKGTAVALSVGVLGPAALVAAGLGGASLMWYRRHYRSTLESARNEMRRALDAVAAAVQSEDVFGTLPWPVLSHRTVTGT